MTARPDLEKSVAEVFWPLFTLEFLIHAQCELRRLGIHLLNCSWSLISKYLKMIGWMCSVRERANAGLFNVVLSLLS